MAKDRVAIIMENLGLTEEEALELIEEDKRIDRMTVREAESDISQDAKKAIHDVKITGKIPTVYNFSKRERKADNDKSSIIDNLITAMENFGGSNIEILNPEREFTVIVNDRKFKITLSAPRK